MAKSIALAADASRLASLLLSYAKGECAFVAPRHPRASTAIIDRLPHSRTLSIARSNLLGQGAAAPRGRASSRLARALHARHSGLACLRMAERTRSIDVLRGIAMVLMVLDHARDFFVGLPGSPTDLASTNVPLFFTRWLTHFCAPVFVLLAGTAAYLHSRKHGLRATRRFLWTRGLWLIVLELSVVRFAWIPDPFYHFSVLQVIWALGWSMLALLLSTAWLLPWYAIWLLPLAAVGGDRRLRVATLLFCAYAILIHLSLANPILSPLQEPVFIVLDKLSQSAVSYFQLPRKHVIEIGNQIEI